MNRLIIIRTYGERQTTSDWYVYSENDELQYQCVGLENPWKDNRQYISCIPEGHYSAIKIRNHHRFGDCFFIEDVANRSEIMIHALNYVHQTDGCPGPGIEYKKINDDELVDLYRSDKALKDLWKNLPEEFNVIIENSEKYA